MDTHTSHTLSGSRTSLVAVLLMLAIAASVVMLQAKAIWSTGSEPAVRPRVLQSEPDHAYKDDWVHPKQDNGGGDRLSLQEILAKKQ